MSKLSALLIVYNEIKHLQAAIDTVSFADEIIVVDSFSTDGTYEALLKDERLKVVQKKFEDYASQRNYALELANYNWVLFLDADERIPQALQLEIQKTIQGNSEIAAFYFYRQFMYKDKILRFSGMQTDKIYRLFQKNKARYIPSRLVHEDLEVDGKSGIFKNKLIHYSFDDYDIFKGKMLSYGRLKARELFAKGEKFSILKLYFRTIYKFVNHYFLRLGILDGKKGWVISKLNAMSVAERYKELRRLWALSPK